MKLNIDAVHAVIASNRDLKNYYKWYLTYCNSLCVPYHNLNHTLGMMYHILCIYNESQKKEHEYGFRLTEQDLYILMTSALFHDYNHSAGVHPDSVNVATAKAGLNRCLREFLVADETTESLIKICEQNIDATQFPYVIKDEDLNLYQRILRECDLLVSLYDDYFTHAVMGLYYEMKPQTELIDFVASNMQFLNDSFKNFKLVYSIDIWNQETDNFLQSAKNIIDAIK